MSSRDFSRPYSINLHCATGKRRSFYEDNFTHRGDKSVPGARGRKFLTALFSRHWERQARRQYPRHLRRRTSETGVAMTVGTTHTWLLVLPMNFLVRLLTSGIVLTAVANYERQYGDQHLLLMTLGIVEKT